jgi:preprotein translocase subunit YajC
MHAFQVAMFALLIPALLLFLSVFFLVFRRARTNTPARASLRKSIFRWRLSSSSAKPLEGRA